MLIGEYIHTLDPKKRVSMPAKFRKEIGKKVVITRGLDNCLFVYPIKQWEKVTEKLTESSVVGASSDTRGFNRFMLAGAVETGVDSLGRVLVPDFLKDFAGLKSKVAVIGVHNHIEIWDEKGWKSYRGKIEKQADVLAEKLSEIGVL